VSDCDVARFVRAIFVWRMRYKAIFVATRTLRDAFCCYKIAMEIEFDPDKDAINLEKHGLSLADAVRLDWSNAVVLPDLRFDYPEPRFRAFAPIGHRLYMVAYTMRGERYRMISFRKASAMEIKRYGKD